MKLSKLFLLTVSHGVFAAVGFAAGLYALPILIAPPAPTDTMVSESAKQASYTAEFVKELADSDAFHWGEGTVSISPQQISFQGELAPGPDYKLYLSPTFVETEADFEALKADMVQVGNVSTFENFIVDVPAGIDPSEYSAVIVWCETFGEFITAAAYR